MKYSLRSLMTFSIRDLLWLMVVVGLGLAWWIDRRGIQRDRDVWKYHAEGAKELSSYYHVNEIEINSKEMIGKKPNGETYDRTWPDGSWWWDNPAEGPNRPRKPKW
jgi:hypothetical protein